MRPSGTEPKIKFYYGCNVADIEVVDNKLEEIIKFVNDIVYVTA